MLVTGATGYVGGRLVPRLLDSGFRVRVLARDASRLQNRSWLDRAEVAEGDVLDPSTLPAAMKDVESAYYLIHGMREGEAFHQRDLLAARNFAQATKESGVGRIIYLGGLGDPHENLSAHLRSRQETGDVLRQVGVSVTEFRAAIIVGAGSVSFEMIRYLTERVPVMICPRWVFTRVQPIAIEAVLDYLVAAHNTPESSGKVIEIGGSDVLTYGQMMLGYAKVRRLRRMLLPVPVLTPRLSSYWVHLVTPIPGSIAQPLIEGLRNEVVVRDPVARRLFPSIQPAGYQTAVEAALANLESGGIDTAWSDSLASSQGDPRPVVLTTKEGMIIERRQTTVAADPEVVYRILTGLGGDRGWLTFNWAWRLRGTIDRLAGGVGLRRGRRDPDDVRPGDAVDFWRVETIVPDRLLRLRAEMKVPGRAWLQFETERLAQGTLLVQSALFAPRGLLGLAYWYGLYPIHGLLFSRLITAIKRQAETALGAPRRDGPSKPIPAQGARSSER